MTDKKADHLKKDDRIVWDIVRQTARPLRLEEAVSFAQLNEDFPKLLKTHHSVIRENTISKTTIVKKNIGTPSILDRKTYRKISRGQLNIDARIDLHGMTQSQAYQFLLNFIQSATSRGLRHVLVITGKGKSFGSDGILKQAIPHWLSTAPFRVYVSAYEDAARHHGGNGALYLRLRRGNS